MPAPASAPSRGWHNGSLVRRLDSDRVRLSWKVLVWGFLAASPLLLYVFQTTRYVTTSYSIEELRARQERLVEAERRLRIERAVLQSLAAVETTARKDLGLEPPAAGHMIVVAPRAPAAPDRDVRNDKTRSPARR